jgi:predicted transcriptional regulator
MTEPQSVAGKQRQRVTRLGLALTAYQQKYDVANGRMAKEIGISEPMLSRIKGGTMPDGSNLMKIFSWLSEIQDYP